MSTASLLQALPAWLQGAQARLLQGLHALGLAADVDGQPSWPFAWRLAVETLAQDAALARQLLWSGVFLLLSMLLLILAWRWRRGRWSSLVLVALLIAATPWPDTALIWTAALPTSFHRAPLAPSSEVLASGLRRYQQYCVACHGADGRGETPLAASLPVWPPRLSGGLLWKRAPGESYWHVRHGMRDRSGRETMPAFAERLQPDEVWSLLAAMKLLASGQSLRSEGRWAWPLRAPDLEFRCEDGRPRRLADWRGQRVRIVLAGTAGWPREDARFQTVVLADGPGGEGCVAADAGARQVFALLAGAEEATGVADVVGSQFIVDREGWLRALSRPGRGNWSAEDLLCRSDAAPVASSASAVVGEGGLDALIRRMEADPVRGTAGMPHSVAP